MLAGFQSRDGKGAMQVMRCGNGYRSDRGIVQQRAPVAVGPAAVLTRKSLGDGLLFRTDGDEMRAASFGNRPRMIGAEKASPQNSNTDHDRPARYLPRPE